MPQIFTVCNQYARLACVRSHDSMLRWTFRLVAELTIVSSAVDEGIGANTDHSDQAVARPNRCIPTSPFRPSRAGNTDGPPVGSRVAGRSVRPRSNPMCFVS